jgi:hypothetical protein
MIAEADSDAAAVVLHRHKGVTMALECDQRFRRSLWLQTQMGMAGLWDKGLHWLSKARLAAYYFMLRCSVAA